MKLTQKNFNELVNSLNHRMSNIEINVEKLRNDTKWMKRLGYYMATLLTFILVGGLTNGIF